MKIYIFIIFLLAFFLGYYIYLRRHKSISKIIVLREKIDSTNQKTESCFMQDGLKGYINGDYCEKVDFF